MDNHPKVLVTGGSGFIGSHLTSFLEQQGYIVFSVDVNNGKDGVVDVSDFSQIHDMIKCVRPNVVIHCAARKNLPDCEECKSETFLTNVLSTEHIANLSQLYNYKIIYISSDVVFDGKKGNYKLQDEVNPINWYGKTKAFSEIILRGTLDYAICRTALVIGCLNKAYKKLLEDEKKEPVLVNQTLLPQFIYERLGNNLTVELPSIYLSNPTPIELLSLFILKIIEQDQVGTYHTCGVDAVSRFEFANIIATLFKFNPNLIKLDNTMISPLRPKDITMNVKDSFDKLKIKMDDWKLINYLKRRELYE